MDNCIPEPRISQQLGLEIIVNLRRERMEREEREKERERQEESDASYFIPTSKSLRATGHVID